MFDIVNKISKKKNKIKYSLVIKILFLLNFSLNIARLNSSLTLKDIFVSIVKKKSINKIPAFVNR